MSVVELLAVATEVAGHPSSIDTSFGCLTIDVLPERWVVAATAIRDDPRSECGFFDWLSAYDDRDAGLAVVVNVWSVGHRHGVILRTPVARTGGWLPSLTTVWRGADWHERETFEMFGISFEGHPDLRPLLLPDGFEGNPLRKEFVLASRVAKAWPGQKEPGESDADLSRADGPSRARRRRLRPPGVPEPGGWGPDQ
jgi:NADH-quinone oxidoreductase subunit C